MGHETPARVVVRWSGGHSLTLPSKLLIAGQRDECIFNVQISPLPQTRPFFQCLRYCDSLIEREQAQLEPSSVERLARWKADPPPIVASSTDASGIVYFANDVRILRALLSGGEDVEFIFRHHRDQLWFFTVEFFRSDLR